MITPKFSFELPELGVTLDDKWALGYSFGTFVISKNGEMRIIDYKIAPEYNLDTYPIQIPDKVDKLVAMWSQDIALDKGEQGDKETSMRELVKTYEKGRKR